MNLTLRNYYPSALVASLLRSQALLVNRHQRGARVRVSPSVSSGGLSACHQEVGLLILYMPYYLHSIHSATTDHSTVGDYLALQGAQRVQDRKGGLARGEGVAQSSVIRPRLCEVGSGFNAREEARRCCSNTSEEGVKTAGLKTLLSSFSLQCSRRSMIHTVFSYFILWSRALVKSESRISIFCRLRAAKSRRAS